MTIYTLKRNRKISRSMMGHIVSPETRLKISNTRKRLKIPSPTLGKKYSQKTIEKIKANHKGMLGKKHTIITRFKMSKAWKKRSDYTGGSSKILKEIRMSLKYKIWREKVLKRDNYTCKICKKRNNLQADHIKSFTYFPKLRFVISNGRTLCKKCHKKTDNYGEKAKKFKQ